MIVEAAGIPGKYQGKIPPSPRGGCGNLGRRTAGLKTMHRSVNLTPQLEGSGSC